MDIPATSSIDMDKKNNKKEKGEHKLLKNDISAPKDFR